MKNVFPIGYENLCKASRSYTCMANSSSEPYDNLTTGTSTCLCLQPYFIHYTMFYYWSRRCLFLSIKAISNSNITLYAEELLEKLFMSIFPLQLYSCLYVTFIR